MVTIWKKKAMQRLSICDRSFRKRTLYSSHIRLHQEEVITNKHKQAGTNMQSFGAIVDAALPKMDNGGNGQMLGFVGNISH